jgi:hypothetical protein
MSYTESIGGNPSSRTMALVNPIGAGLAHYTKSLDHVLQSCGVSTYRVDVTEPSSADYGKMRWLLDYFFQIRRRIAHDDPEALIAAWPAIGYWDLPVLAMIAGRRSVYMVMHDPQPLVYARGYGTIAKALARRQRGVAIVAHSPEAVRVIASEAGMPRVFEALHPMLEPRQAPQQAGAHQNIRVLGQYKVDRDIGGLERLAANAPPNWRLEIIGRGWPTVSGWHIRSEFVAEEDFDELVHTSHAVVIPYSRFFQSGVAIRALEWGVPVVGPHASSLRIALGDDCPWLVRDGDWATAVGAAVQEDRDGVLGRAWNLYTRVIKDWSSMLEKANSRGASPE